MTNRQAVNLIFEAAVAGRMERTGWQILGDNRETVANHTFMTAVIAYILTGKVKAAAPKTRVSLETVLLMSLFHDFHEARTGDVDKIAKRYVTRDEAKANRDIFDAVDPELFSVVSEYESGKSMESRIVYEANILALIVELKKLMENGNVNAKEWFEGNITRLKLKESLTLAYEIEASSTQDWWKSIRDELHREFRK